MCVGAGLCRTSCLGGRRAARSRWHINQHGHSVAYLSTPPSHPLNVTCPACEVDWFSKAILFCFFPARVTMPRTSCRSLASARSVGRSSCGQICPLFFFSSPPNRTVDSTRHSHKRVTSFQVGRWHNASASAAQLVVAARTVVQPLQFLFLFFFPFSVSTIPKRPNFPWHWFSVWVRRRRTS